MQIVAYQGGGCKGYFRVCGLAYVCVCKAPYVSAQSGIEYKELQILDYGFVWSFEELTQDYSDDFIFSHGSGIYHAADVLEFVEVGTVDSVGYFNQRFVGP
jgi:hypothetical protein